MSRDELDGVMPLSQMESGVLAKVAAAMPEERDMTLDQIVDAASGADVTALQVLKALRTLVDNGAVACVDGKYRRLSRDARG